MTYTGQSGRPVASAYSPQGFQNAEDVKEPSVTAPEDEVLKNGGGAYPYTPPETEKLTGDSEKVVAPRVSKRKGWLIGGITTMIIGGGGMFGMGFLPGFALVNFKEVMVGKFGANIESIIDARSQQMWVKKLNSSSKTPGIKGMCNTVKVACRFDGMSDRSVEKMQKRAGITVELDENDRTLTGKKRVKSLTFTDTDGTRRTITNASDYNDLIRNNKALRSQLNKMFKPRFAVFAGGKIKSLFSYLKISKGKSTSTAVTTEEARERVASNQRGQTASTEIRGVTSGKDSEGNATETDADRVKNGTAQSLINEAMEYEGKPRLSTSSLKTVAGGVAKGVMITGAADTACTVLNTMSAIGYLAKVLGSVQLVRFAMTFMNQADAIKAGEATSASIQALGEMLASAEQNLSEEAGEIIDNFGTSAWDSYGYQYAAYNLLGPPIDTSEFKVGGGLPVDLLDIRQGITNFLVGADKATCGFIQNPWTRLGSAAVGIIAGIFSGGTTSGTSIAITTGLSIFLETTRQFALPIIASIMVGDFVGPDVVAQRAGNAYTSGAAELYSSTGLASGMYPLTVDQKVALDNTVTKDYIAWYRENERMNSSPFDIYNPYTVTGSIASGMIPYVAGGSLTNNLSRVFASVTNPFGLFSSSASASNPGDEYKICTDQEYLDRNFATTPFCNLLPGLSTEALNYDPDSVIENMYNGNYIDENGVATGTYKEWLEKCTDNYGAPFGDKTEDSEVKESFCYPSSKTADLGGLSASTIELFSVYTVDSTIDQQMNCLVDDDATACNSDSYVSDSSSRAPSIEIPDNVDRSNNGWKLRNNTDYTNVPCATGTTFSQVYTHPMNNYIINLCQLPGGGEKFNSLVSAGVVGMFAAAEAESINLSISSGFRSYETQAALYAANCPGGKCTTQTAPPGRSNHESGSALDLKYNGTTICFAGRLSAAQCRPTNNAGFNWLEANANKYGFINYTVEAWHWSPNGA